MRFYNLLFICFLSTILACKQDATKKEVLTTKPTFQNKAHELVYQMVKKVGTYDQLLALKDVVYTYSYKTPDEKEDISTEKYLFDGEMSYALYKKHERTLDNLEGDIEQGFDGANFWLKHAGTYVEDKQALKRVAFNRKTNFYWFAMYQKLLDEGLNYEYVKKDTLEEKIYDVIKVSFASVNSKPTDIYQLYINQETLLVDQFLFTVVDFNVVDTPFLLKMDYEKIDGLLIPTQRKYTKATWEGDNINEQWIEVSWTNIKFNNGISKSLFFKK